MAVYLVRHAKAGKRAEWHGDDRLRPLTGAGRRQAEAIANRLAPVAPPVLVTSPYLRCRQSLEPLADICGVALIEEPMLAEGAPSAPVLAHLRSCADATVLCSHGDVIDDTVELLAAEGADLRDRPGTVRKGVTVVIERRDVGPWLVSFVDCPA